MSRTARSAMLMSGILATLLLGSATADEPPPQTGPCRQCVPIVIGGQQTWLCPDGFEVGATECRIAQTCVEIGGCP